MAEEVSTSSISSTFNFLAANSSPSMPFRFLGLGEWQCRTAMDWHLFPVAFMEIAKYTIYTTPNKLHPIGWLQHLWLAPNAETRILYWTGAQKHVPNGLYMMYET